MKKTFKCPKCGWEAELISEDLVVCKGVLACRFSVPENEFIITEEEDNSTKDRLLELLLFYRKLEANHPGCNCYDQKFWKNNSNLDINNPADHEIWCPEYIMYRIEGIISCDF